MYVCMILDGFKDNLDVHQYGPLNWWILFIIDDTQSVPAVFTDFTTAFDHVHYNVLVDSYRWEAKAKAGMAHSDCGLNVLMWR